MAALPRSPIQDEVLNSWKDIAKYMDRGVRTVQRWELELALPVHRPRGRPRSGVMALRSDLDRWLNGCPIARNQIPIDLSPAHDLYESVVHNSSDLISQSRMLRTELVRFRTDLVRLREDLRLTVNRVSRTVRCFQPEPGFSDSRSPRVV